MAAKRTTKEPVRDDYLQRSVALAHAVDLGRLQGADAPNIVKAAGQFLAFLKGEEKKAE